MQKLIEIFGLWIGECWKFPSVFSSSFSLMSLASKCGEKLLQNKQLKAHYKRVKSFPNISKYDKILLEKKVSCNEGKHTHTHTLSLG